MLRHVRQFLTAKSGTSAIEFAFLAPLMIMMFAGVVEIGRVFQVHNAANRLATQYAITWSDCSELPPQSAGACNTELGSFTSANMIRNLVPQLDSSALTLSMYQVSMSGTTPTVTYAYPSGSALSAAQIAAVQNVLTNGQSGVIVTVSYAHTLQYFSALMSPYISSALTAAYTAVQLKS